MMRLSFKSSNISRIICTISSVSPMTAKMQRSYSTVGKLIKEWTKPMINTTTKTTGNHRYRRTVQVWNTPCIVSNFGRSTTLIHPSLSASASVSALLIQPGETSISASSPSLSSSITTFVLINPTNPQLSGVKNFPYFPRGGPVPSIVTSSSHSSTSVASSQWGGMDVGSNMLYPSQVVDGLVHSMVGHDEMNLLINEALIQKKKKEVEGEKVRIALVRFVEDGWQRLQQQLLGWNYRVGTKNGSDEEMNNKKYDDTVKCSEGEAIITPLKMINNLSDDIIDDVTSNGKRNNHHNQHLSQRYDAVVHTVPPFFSPIIGHNNSHNNVNDNIINDNNINEETRKERILLGQCYKNSIRLATATKLKSSPLPPRRIIIASPLLGAGCRGFPMNIATSIASSIASNWLLQQSSEYVDDNDNTDDNGDKDKHNENNVVDVVLAFVIPDSNIRNVLISSLDEKLLNQRQNVE